MGICVGLGDGPAVGASVGLDDGPTVGIGDGPTVGIEDGVAVGTDVGETVGSGVGTAGYDNAVQHPGKGNTLSVICLCLGDKGICSTLTIIYRCNGCQCCNLPHKSTVRLGITVS